MDSSSTAFINLNVTNGLTICVAINCYHFIYIQTVMLKGVFKYLHKGHRNDIRHTCVLYVYSTTFFASILEHLIIIISR